MSKFDGSKGPPTIEGMASLKVDNLTYRTSSEDLERYFKKFGNLGDIYIPRDRDTHESRGFAFVRFYDERDAEEAMDSMDGKVIDGREIRVAMARYGRPSNQYDPRRQGGGRRDRGSSGYRDRDRRDDRRGGDRRRSPPRRKRSYSKSRSRSRSRDRRSRSRSHSPRFHKRSNSRSPPRRSPRRSASPRQRSESPARRSASPRRSRSRSRSHHD